MTWVSVPASGETKQQTERRLARGWAERQPPEYGLAAVLAYVLDDFVEQAGGDSESPCPVCGALVSPSRRRFGSCGECSNGWDLDEQAERAFAWRGAFAPVERVPVYLRRRMVEMRDAGMTYQAIADHLNERDITTPLGRPWTTQNAWQHIENRRVSSRIRDGYPAN